MYCLNAFLIVVFSLFNVAAVQLCKCEDKTRQGLVRALCIILLGLNLFRYALSRSQYRRFTKERSHALTKA